MTRHPRPRTALSRAGLLLAAALAGLSACSSRPPAVPVALRPQPVLQSAAHWQVVATDVASAISAHLEFQTGKKVPVQVYMMRNASSPFGTAFASAVETRLVGLGHLVAVDPRPDVVAVGIDMQIVRTDPTRAASRTTPGPLTVLASGIGVAGVFMDRFPWGISAIAAGLGLDYAANRPLETDTELVLTLSMERGGFYTFRTTGVYYINGWDIDLYEGADPRRAPNLNDVPQRAIAYDLAGMPYVVK